MASTGPSYTRRTVLRAGGGVIGLGLLSPYVRLVNAAHAAPGIRKPGSLPDPSRAAGTPTAALPFDHIVVVMQENHSFDNYFGMLALRGQPLADGFSFDSSGHPTNANPVAGGYITVAHAPSECTPDGSGSQSWNDTHIQIDQGRMDGFAKTGKSSMSFWDEADLPFYYSMAKTFCLANRWFCSAPCQTYPNRRFLLAGTAFGLISTDTSSITENPPNGTIVDRLNAHNISWTDYFTDLPATGVIESIPQNNPSHLASVDQFYADCAAGTLPAVSFVDSDIGAAPTATGEAPAPFSGEAGPVSNQNQDEENGDISLGENFVSQVVGAVLKSPLWPRILLVWLYDEHGGWYDHVPPPAAILPDSIPPKLGPKDIKGGYDIYGPRVPAVSVSGHARPRSVTGVVHDHTSILATIEAKWNLPAMTYRDANAATMADFLSDEVTFHEPPTLAAPANLSRSETSCTSSPISYTSHPGPTASPATRVLVAYRLTHHRHRLVVELRTSHGVLEHLRLQLTRGQHVVAHRSLSQLSPAGRRLVFHLRREHRLRHGRYELVVRQGHRVLARRGVVV